MFRSPLFPIFLTVFVDVLALTLVIPLLPFYAEHFGATPLVVTYLPASFAICQLVSGPILGRLSDRLGRKPVLLVSQLGTCAGFLIVGGATSLWMLFLGRIIDGLTAGNLSIAQAYISDVTKPENRTRAFGIIGIAFGVGFTIGPAISGIIAHRFGFNAPLYGAAALSLLSVFTTWTMLPRIAPRHEAPVAAPAPAPAADGAPALAPPRSEAAGGRIAFMMELFRQRGPRQRLLEFFFFALSFSTLVGNLALFLERQLGYNVEKVGYVYAFSGVCGALVQGGIGKLVKRLGEERLSRIGFVAMGLGYGLLGLAFHLPVLLTMVVVSAFGAAVTRPSLTTLLTKSVGRDVQGAVLGVSQSLNSIAIIIGPPIAGYFIENQVLWAYGALAGGFALCGALISLFRENAPATA